MVYNTQSDRIYRKLRTFDEGEGSGPTPPPPSGPTIVTIFDPDSVPILSVPYKNPNAPNKVGLIAPGDRQAGTAKMLYVDDQDEMKFDYPTQIPGLLAELFFRQSVNDGAMVYEKGSEVNGLIALNRPSTSIARPYLTFDHTDNDPIWGNLPQFTDRMVQLFAGTTLPNGTILYKHQGVTDNVQSIVPPPASNTDPRLAYNRAQTNLVWAEDRFAKAGNPSQSLADPVLGYNRQSQQPQWRDNVQTLGIHSFGKTGTFTSPNSSTTRSYTIGVEGSTTIPRARLLRGTFYLMINNPAADIANGNAITKVDWVSDSNGDIKFFAESQGSTGGTRWVSTNRINFYISSTNQWYATINTTSDNFELTITRIGSSASRTIYVIEETTYLDETPSPSPTPQQNTIMYGVSQRAVAVQTTNGGVVHVRIGNGDRKDILIGGIFSIMQNGATTNFNPSDEFTQHCTVYWTLNAARNAIQMWSMNYPQSGGDALTRPVVGRTHFALLSESRVIRLEGQFDINHESDYLNIELTTKVNDNSIDPVYIHELYWHS